MAKFVTLTLGGLTALREIDERLVSYNIEMTEVTGGTFWKAYTEAHKSAVIGDTVGDPFKDTAGPSINTQITVVSLVESLLSSLFVAFSVFG